MSGSKAPNLYETDFIAWAEEQASALRAIADPSLFGLDLPNLIEEVEALARSDLFELEDRLRSALTRLLLAACEPEPDRSHAALAGVSRPLIDARSWRSPTGVSRLELDRIWSEAWEEAGAALPPDALPSGPGPCPFGAEELLGRGFSPKDGAARIRRALVENGPPSLNPDLAGA